VKTTNIIIIPGIVILILGIIFHLQGISIIGPETSFMYSNSKWETFGIQITIMGIIVIGTGVFVKIVQRN
jgi:hypothetical protein